MSHSQEGEFRPDQILVAIPTLNEADHIEVCLRSLIEDKPFMEQVSIVVADGGSTDGTQETVLEFARRAPQVRLIENPERYQSAAINTIVQQKSNSDHRFLVRCDAHSIYPKGYIRRVVEAISRHPKAASVVTVMDATGSSCFQSACAWVVDTRLGSGGAAHRGGERSGWIDHGHHAGFRIEWFEGLGGYDPSFTHNEDAELDYRLGLAGGKIWLEASIRLKYQMRPTARALFRQYRSYGRGRACTVFKHMMRPRLRQMVPVTNLILLAACLVIAPIWPSALLLPFLYILALTAVSVTASVVMRSMCGLLAGPALFIIHNAWAVGFIWECGRKLVKR